MISLAAGLAAAAAVAVLAAPELAALTAWTVAFAVLLTWVWRICWNRDAAATEELAEEENRSRSTDVWVLLAAVASLAAVVVALVQSSSQQDAAVLLSVLAVILSWALVNTVFAFKYARLYYLDEPDAKGIDFKQSQPPAYSDFAYLAFTIGMSFAVPEAEPASTRIRRVALGHALLSYLFGTGVLAVAINLVTNLGQ
ncbi:DUF1345 domain-containing protein [Kineosporia sp. J2-2]|uniref:DUF1345 domain-containing protein n=1 Tax=Kineosporia corallincola TaxID=2835133 RepID=A0ABS5TC93_9ACTN|nr:DUF1345 domain-containing protein [Kineosporia corallincola]MBT0768670.1 DUF1345 domain-containing protein [Kineosporia corallincola]